MNSTISNHRAKHTHNTPLCLPYEASDNSITGRVPHLKLWIFENFVGYFFNNECTYTYKYIYIISHSNNKNVKYNIHIYRWHDCVLNQK